MPRIPHWSYAYVRPGSATKTCFCAGSAVTKMSKMLSNIEIHSSIQLVNWATGAWAHRDDDDAMGPENECRGIPSSSIEHLRSFLISSLPHENIGEHDRQRVGHLKKVAFDDGTGEAFMWQISMDDNWYQRTYVWTAFGFRLGREIGICTCPRN